MRIHILLLALLLVHGCNGCRGCESSTEKSAGAFELNWNGEAVTVEANRAPRQALLTQLAERAGFALVSQTMVPGEVTLTLRDAPVEAVLSAILDDLAYSASYLPRQTRKVNVPVRVTLGEASEETGGSGMRQARVDSNEVQVDPSTEAVAVAAAEQVNVSEGQQVFFDRGRSGAITAGEPGERVARVKSTPPTGPGLSALQGVLAKDPDPHVRAQAAHQMGGGSGYATTDALLRALDDSDPQVVVSALEALGDVGDGSVVQRVREILEDHPDPGVNAALKNVVDQLQRGARLDAELPGTFEYAPKPPPNEAVQGGAKELDVATASSGAGPTRE